MSAETIPVPSGLTDLVSLWERAGRPGQSGITWPQSAWMDYFPSHAAVFRSLPERITRQDVRHHARSAAESDAAALEAFLSVMAWGYGNVGYGPWRVHRILELNPNAGANLRQAAQLLATEGAVPAYDFLASRGRMKFLGPAFGTKYLHFVAQSKVGPPALILDAIVSRAVRSLSELRFSATGWSSETYQRYLATLSGWASQLEVEPVDVEMLLFVGQSPGQWAERWLNDRNAP